MISDIAYSLSHQCRFNGHCKAFYSVAQHSYLASYAVYTLPGLLIGTHRRDVALEALMHDAHEAYVGDISYPLRQVICSESQILEDIILALDRKIRRKFGLPEKLSEMVRDADLMMLATERRDIVPTSRDDIWPSLNGVLPLYRRIRPVSQELAEAQFYRRFYELTSV